MQVGGEESSMEGGKKADAGFGLKVTGHSSLCTFINTGA